MKDVVVRTEALTRDFQKTRAVDALSIEVATRNRVRFSWSEWLG